MCLYNSEIHLIHWVEFGLKLFLFLLFPFLGDLGFIYLVYFLLKSCFDPILISFCV